LARDAQQAIMALASASGLPPGHASLHEALAAQWTLAGAGADLVRQTLVLLADHDLNASTFACRVAASTGASMAACLLAGLCALSGPVHGGAAAALLRLIRASETDDATLVIRQWLDLHGALPGFGHPLYPEGDARANALLDRIAPDPALDRLARAVMDEAGQRPNIDFALAALTRAYELPDDAPFTLFLLGRSVGWAAHAIEQAGLRKIIRPRGIYTGAMPAP
jgi:citrate synthase